MEEFYKDLISLILYLFIFSLAFFFEKKLVKYIEKNLKEQKSSILIVFSIISGFIFLVGWGLSNFITDEFIKRIFKNFVLFSTSIYILRSVFSLFIKTTSSQYVLYSLLTLVFIISIIRTNLAYIHKESFIKYLAVFEKFLIVLIIYLLFSKGFEQLKAKHLVKFLKLATLSSLIVFFIIWGFGLVKLSFETLIGFIILLAITGIYYYLKTFSLKQFIRYVERCLNRNDIEALVFNIQIFLTGIYILFVKELLAYFLNLNVLIKILDNYYILKNELVSISIYSILKVIVAGFILFSLLNILKKLVKLSFLREKRYIEGGSAEALIFNLGILFNIMILMSILGITWKVILPLAGTLGIGIGFGLQTIMNNYISGFILMFSRKLKVGDIVELPSISVSTLGNDASNIFGKIEDIGILSTIVKTNDGVDISIPNSEFLNSPIINFSYRDPLVRLRIPIGVAYSSDPYQVKEILLSVAEEIQRETNRENRALPPIQIWFSEMGDSSLVFITAMWINIRENLSLTAIISDFYYKVWYKLKEANIEIPFPQNDVWFRNKLKVEIEKTVNPLEKGGK